ncbi:virulence RhuM family protein [Flavobacterium poyangense]|nr:virulence RhuM family protein [Flavobacterium sp. JXAS1]
MDNLEANSNFIFYTNESGNTNINVVVDKDTVWITQLSMAEIFGVQVPAISKHLSNIFEEGELIYDGTVSKMEIVQKEGKRNVRRNVEYYNLDAIISVGYRVNSVKATQFRIWATNVLKEYLIKGFALNDDRLKQGKTLFGKDYFDELLEKIREIRASERRFYQKITDLYATSVDYDSKSKITQVFFSTVQNKLEFAITHLTAPEIIKERADSKKPNMGLTSFKNSNTGGKVLKTDVCVAKNYLNEDEISELNILVNMYLDYAELQAKRNKLMSMNDWVNKLDAFLQFNEYDLLKNSGKFRADVAKKLLKLNMKNLE